ncbi:MAG: hypothetical protein EOO11_04820, partial [Chitinophagaceae bacterium]
MTFFPARRASRRDRSTPPSFFLFRMALALLVSAGTGATMHASAQNALDRVGLTAARPASPAYALRKLSNAYAGKAVQVRRSSDNTTQDIGFTANGDLDTS